MSTEDDKIEANTGSDTDSEEESEDSVDEASELESRLEEAERERDQFKRLAQRAQADLVNYRNRVREEQESLQGRTVERVSSRFIEIADQLERALEGEAAAGVEEQWVSGVEGIYQNLLNALKAEGFERFDANGEEFDPRQHDALLVTPTADVPTNHVIRQLVAGYTRHGDVVRPAQVEIASAPEENESDGNE